MALSYPNKVNAFAVALLVAAQLASAQTAGNRLPDGEDLLGQLDLDRSLPINLDAGASEFDRQNDLLRFETLHITQGDLAIRADRAVVARLDFENTVWTFSGNVLMENSSTRVWSDQAEVTFIDHQVSAAVMRGSPARFEQERPGDTELTRGRAETMDYSLEQGVIRMDGDAWISDGANEVSGPRIAYDVGLDLIKAVGDDAGPVRMKIIPPAERESGTP